MAKEEKQPNTSQEERPAGKGFFRRLPTLLLVLAVVLTVVVLTTMEDGRHFVSLRRWLMYGESSAAEDMYVYAADPMNRFGGLGEGLLVATPNTIQFLRDNGTSLYELPVTLTSPSLSVGREQAVVCDIGGETLYVLDEAGILRTLHTERGLSYYAARLNSRDWLAVTEQKSGYKAAVSVYDSKGELKFRFDSHENYISDAVVTEDCRYVVAVSLAPQNGVFGSSLLVYDLGTAELVSSAAIPDGLPLELAVNKGRVMALCDKRLSITTLEGEELLDRPYGHLYLHDYALAGGDFCALLLGRYQAGNICELTTFDLDGQEIATMELTEEVLDMAASGKYLTVLYSDSLVVYTRDLKEFARLEDTDYAGQVQMGADGSALVIGATAAWRFLP